MQNVLMLQPPLLFYRVRIYNKLSRYLRRRGYNLIVWPTHLDAQDEPVEFNCLDEPMTVANLRQLLGREDIDIVVNHLGRTTVNIPFYLAVAIVARLSGRRFVYYGHGLNLWHRDRRTNVLFSNLYHLSCHQVILYSPREKRYLWRCNQRKAVVAYNTLDMEGVAPPPGSSRAKVADRYGITESRIVLFSGRIWPRKRLDLLLDCFTEKRDRLSDIGLVIVGPDLPARFQGVAATTSNIHYLGPQYQRETMAELFSLADVFCIPGSMGLGIVEAFHAGRPIVTLNAKHGPEAHYLKNGKNCVLVDDERHFADELISLVRDDGRLKAMSEGARRTYEEEAALDRMFEGFHEGLRLAERGRGAPALIGGGVERPNL